MPALPRLDGRPILVRIRPSLGPHLAATSIPKRVILLDSGLVAGGTVSKTRGDFERILVHEIFHFVWVRLSNSTRREWERVLTREFDRRAKGELGWSAEWRKNKLTPEHISSRSRLWRLYACESFCDTAAWRYANLRDHEEFTLAARHRRLRAAWFEKNLETGAVSI